ncbi:MAG: PIN domain-containing protein [Candidatus Aenigmarchaeota archaeon]|nr:PIN domain-containing protein [Candidatus Aenigmarchaeota archaeon]
MSRYVIDTSAWIEYFDASNKGHQVRKLLDEGANEMITNLIICAEAISVVKRRGWDDAEAFEQILSHSSIFNGDINFAREAGLLHAEVRKSIKDFALADAFVLATARRLGAMILTTDPHFRGFKEAVLI